MTTPRILYAPPLRTRAPITLSKGEPCKKGETAAKSGCTPAEGEGGGDPKGNGSIVSKIESEMTDYHSGQADFTSLAIDANGDPIGVIRYAVVGDELIVNHVEVGSKHRRKGVSTELYERMLDDHPDKLLGHSAKTPEGAAFRKYLEERHPERIKPRKIPPVEVSGVSDEDWSRAIDAMGKVQTLYGEDSPQEGRMNDLMDRLNEFDNEDPHTRNEEDRPDIENWIRKAMTP